jgi:hypothetical protein
VNSFLPEAPRFPSEKNESGFPVPSYLKSLQPVSQVFPHFSKLIQHFLMRLMIPVGKIDPNSVRAAQKQHFHSFLVINSRRQRADDLRFTLIISKAPLFAILL